MSVEGFQLQRWIALEFLYLMIQYTMHPQPTVVSYTFEKLTNDTQPKVAATWNTKD